jgi:hypothetical protein
MFPLTLGGMNDEVVAIFFFGGTMVVWVVAILTRTIRAVMISRHTEESRREIAAYVAEGSMTPEDGAKLIAAGKPEGRGSCWTGKA